MSNYDSWKTRSDRDDRPDRDDHPELADDDERFDVWQFLSNGLHEKVRGGVSAEEAVKAAGHYAHNVAAQVLGIVERVIITDADDYCAFEWKKGEGVTFPPECRGWR
jgi:hypothetical protein